jgi:hypothetical protein
MDVKQGAPRGRYLIRGFGTWLKEGECNHFRESIHSFPIRDKEIKKKLKEGEGKGANQSVS